MKKKTIAVYAFWILFTEAVGAVAGFLTRQGTEAYAATIHKPPLSPPGWVFPVVWGILYLLMGISAARVYLSEPGKLRDRGLMLYILQLGFNFFWSLIFFNRQNFLFAFIWLLVLLALILLMIDAFKKVDPKAGKLQIPYALWVTFAGYLNLGVYLLNR